MNEKFTDYLAHIRVQAAIQMLEAGRDVKSIPEAVGYKDEKSFYSVFRRFAGCSMREYQQKLNLSQRKRRSIHDKAMEPNHAAPLPGGCV